MHRLLIVAVLLALFPAPARAQAFASWLNERIDSVVAVKLAMRDPAKDYQIPARSTGEENLVERAGIPDIAGIAINLPDQPSSDGLQQGTTTSLSATPYLLLGLFGGRPFDPDFYLGNAWARRLGLHLTLDTDSVGRTTGEFQGKFIVLDRGTALDVDRTNRISTALSRATSASRTLMEQIQLVLFERVGRPDGLSLTAFVNTLQQDAGLRNALARGGSEARAEIDRIIERQITDIVALRQAVDSLTAATRSRPLLAVGLTGNTTGTRPQKLRAAAIFDLGRPQYDVTLNAIYEYGAPNDTSEERSTVEAAAQGLLRLSRPRLDGRAPPSLAIAGSLGYEIEGRGLIYKAQGRLMLPLSDGVNVPLSVTWASSTDLIDESEVRGHVGFTFNMARIIDSVR